MIKAYIMKLEGKSKYAPTGKFHIRGEFVFDKPLTQEEITNFEKTIYISNEDLQQRIDKALDLTHYLLDNNETDSNEYNIASQYYDILKGSEE